MSPTALVKNVPRHANSCPAARPHRRGGLVGARLRFIATIEDPVVFQRILRHVGLPTATPELALARLPPAPLGPILCDVS